MKNIMFLLEQITAEVYVTLALTSPYRNSSKNDLAQFLEAFLWSNKSVIRPMSHHQIALTWWFFGKLAFSIFFSPSFYYSSPSHNFSTFCYVITSLLYGTTIAVCVAVSFVWRARKWVSEATKTHAFPIFVATSPLLRLPSVPLLRLSPII